MFPLVVAPRRQKLRRKLVILVSNYFADKRELSLSNLVANCRDGEKPGADGAVRDSFVNNLRCGYLQDFPDNLMKKHF